MLDVPSPSRLRLPLVGPLSDAVLGWAAVVVFLVWWSVHPLGSIYGVPLRAVWVALVCLAILGTTIGANVGRYGWMVILALGAMVLAVLVFASFIHGFVPRAAEPYMHLSVNPGAQRITAVACGVALASLVVGYRRRRNLRPADLLVIGVVAMFLVDDLVNLNGQLMRDLKVYLISGQHFFDGQQPYLTAPLTSLPTDQSALPFLYPPFTLPFFGVLSQLPQGLVIAAWLALSLVTAVFALRWLGVSPWWIPVLLLWPPVFLGIIVGNVAVLTFGIFAASPRVPWSLPLMAVFKLQSAVPSIWLVREGRWRSLAIGLGLLVGITLVTLPIVGASAWGDWYRGLRLFQDSEVLYHGLYGLALPRYIPYEAFLLIAALAVLFATIYGRGRAGLARLGIASVVASPSLYRHGFMVMLPALLGNGELVFWLSLGLNGGAAGWALTAVLAAVGTSRFASTAERSADTVHPLGHLGAPWSGLAPESPE
jgi:Glycosyltransferase family 87